MCNSSLGFSSSFRIIPHDGLRACPFTNLSSAESGDSVRCLESSFFFPLPMSSLPDLSLSSSNCLERFRGKAMTLEPAVARLISFGDGGDTDDGGSADDTAVLVEEKKMRRRSSSLSEQAPKPKPRRKKMSPKVDQSSSSTEDTPTRKAAPPPPAPYHDHTRRSTSPLPRSTSVDSFQTQETTPFINKDPTSPSRSDSTGSNYQSKPVRPPRAHEVSYSRQLDEDNDRSGSEDIGRGKKKDDSRQRTLSPDSADDKFVKGHARNPSWGMILKDEENPSELLHTCTCI